MLSPSYGVYSGYEFFENVPAEKGSEEYLDSEKYELKPRPLGRKGPLLPLIKKINEIRRENDHFSELTNLVWHETDTDDVIAFSKTSRSGHDPIVVVANLAPRRSRTATIELDLAAIELDKKKTLTARDLITGRSGDGAARARDRVHTRRPARSSAQHRRVTWSP